MIARGLSVAGIHLPERMRPRWQYWQFLALMIVVGSLLPLHLQLVEGKTYTIGDPEYLRIFTKTYHQVWTEILSQGGYLVSA